MALWRRQSEDGSLIRISPLTPSLQQWPSLLICRPVPRQRPLAPHNWAGSPWWWPLDQSHSESWCLAWQELRCLGSSLCRMSSSRLWGVVLVVKAGRTVMLSDPGLDSCLLFSFSFPPGATLRSATPVSLELFWKAVLPGSLSRLQESSVWAGAVS